MAQQPFLTLIFMIMENWSDKTASFFFLEQQERVPSPCEAAGFSQDLQNHNHKAIHPARLHAVHL